MTPVRLAAIVILSLGMAGTFAVGAVVSQLRRIPHVHAPDQLVHIVETGARGEARAVRPALLGEWLAYSHSIAAVAGYNPRVRDLPMVSGDRAAIVTAVLVTSNFFDVLGVVPARGRPGEIGIILSHDFWVAHFQQDEGIVGRAVALEGVMGWRVLAIAPPGIQFPARADIWQVSSDLDTSRSDVGTGFYHVIARKRPGRSDRQVSGELAAIAESIPTASLPMGSRLKGSPPKGSPPATGVRVTPATTLLGGRLRSPLLLLSMYAVAFLIVAIAGTIHLESMRRLASAQAHAIRLALGATMGNLWREAVRQSLVTWGAAVMVAVPLGAWILHLIVRLVPQLPASGTLLDTTWPLGAALMACPLVAVSAAAVWQTRDLPASAPSLLAGQARAAVPGVTSAWLQRLMVVVSLAGATSVAILSVSAARHHGRELLPALEWDASRVLAADVAYPVIGPDHREGRHPYARYLASTEAIAERFAALPGVMSVSVIEAAPFATGFRTGRVRPLDAGGTEPEPGAEAEAEGVEVSYETIGPGFFSSLDIAPRAGREFTFEDRLPAAIVANSRLPRGTGHMVVSRSLARRLWGDADPVGRRVAVRETFFTTRLVVGVVDDLRLRPAGAVERPVAYVPYLEDPSARLAVVMRVAPSQHPSGSAVRDAFIGAGQQAALGTVEMTSQANWRATAPIRAVVSLYATVAVMTIALCVIAVYATMAFVVRVRRREWAVRLALGGREADLIGRLTVDGLYPVAAGVAIGGVAAWASSSLVRAALESSRVVAFDVATGSLVVLGTALLSCVVAALAIRKTNLVTLLQS